MKGHWRRLTHDLLDRRACLEKVLTEDAFDILRLEWLEGYEAQRRADSIEFMFRIISRISPGGRTRLPGAWSYQELVELLGGTSKGTINEMLKGKVSLRKFQTLQDFFGAHEPYPPREGRYAAASIPVMQRIRVLSIAGMPETFRRHLHDEGTTELDREVYEYVSRTVLRSEWSAALRLTDPVRQQQQLETLMNSAMVYAHQSVPKNQKPRIMDVHAFSGAVYQWWMEYVACMENVFSGA